MSHEIEVYDNVLINKFKHIPEISFYNHNYYIGLKRNEYYNDRYLLNRMMTIQRNGI